MLYGFFLIIHLIVSVLLVVVILMQQAKGGGIAGLGGGLGGGGGAMGGMLGGRQAATLLHKVTVTLALVFGINALLLGGLSRTQSQPQSATLEAIAADEGYPLEFLGESELTPTEQQRQQARENAPQPEESGQQGDVDQPGDEPVQANE